MFRSPASECISPFGRRGKRPADHVIPIALPLVKPYVRNYRIRLSDDPSAIGIRKELTALNSQIDKPLGLQCMIQRRTSKLPTMPLAPRPQKATPPFLHIPVDLSKGRCLDNRS